MACHSFERPQPQPEQLSTTTTIITRLSARRSVVGGGGGGLRGSGRKRGREDAESQRQLYGHRSVKKPKPRRARRFMYGYPRDGCDTAPQLMRASESRSLLLCAIALHVPPNQCRPERASRGARFQIISGRHSGEADGWPCGAAKGD